MTLVTYRVYKTEEEAIELIDLLNSNDIDCQVENIIPSFDITFTGGTGLDVKIAIKLNPTDFKKADNLLIQIATLATESLDLVNKDYYLFDFSDEELFEILENYNEWSITDYVLALKILNERGRNISNEQVQELKNKKINELRQPEKGKESDLIVGLIFALFGGLIGVIIGYHHYRFKKNIVADGSLEKVYAYDTQTRKSGLWILSIALISIIFWLTLLFE